MFPEIEDSGINTILVHSMTPSGESKGREHRGVENRTGTTSKELLGTPQLTQKQCAGVRSARQVWQGNSTQLGVQEKFTVSV